MDEFGSRRKQRHQKRGKAAETVFQRDRQDFDKCHPASKAVHSGDAYVLVRMLDSIENELSNILPEDGILSRMPSEPMDVEQPLTCVSTPDSRDET